MIWYASGSEGDNMVAGSPFRIGAVAKAILPAVVGAAIFLFVYWGFGWWWDGFFLGMLGLVIGQYAGFFIMDHVPRLRDSDVPFTLCAAVGVLTMLALWMWLPEGITQVLGHIARALDGGACGLIFAYGLARMGSESYSQQQGEGMRGAQRNGQHD
jgi:hypothetical protein